MLVRHRLALVALLAISVGAIGCERKRGEITGVGPYEVGKTQLAQVSGACGPDRSQTWCTSLSALKIGEQSASVDLYFDGHEDGAVLVEILLAIRACQPESAASALSHELGEPNQVLEGRLIWNYERTIIIARLPADEPTSCEISFVHPGKTRTIEYLKTGVMPPKPE